MCKWQSQLDCGYHCNVPAVPGSDFCTFHEPAKKDVAKFKDMLYRQIDEEGPKDERNHRFDFRGYVFPVGIAATAEKRDEESDVILPCRLTGDLILAEAQISGNAYFYAADFAQDVDFGDTRFNAKANFVAATFEEVADFSGATFQRDADFWGAMFALGAYFNNTTFEGQAEFADATFNIFVNFEDAIFRGNVCFLRAKAAYIYLGDRRPTILCWAKKRQGVSLQKWLTGHEFWTFAKKTFHKIDERERADAAYYFEKLWRRRARLAGTGGEKLLAGLGYPFDLVFFRLPIAYGASLIRPIITWGVVITLFAGLYAGFPSLIGRTVKSIWQLSNWVIAFHFSVTTFTTLGLGDIHPTRLWGKALTSIEAVFGGVLMALTVVVIGRKFMR